MALLRNVQNVVTKKSFMARHTIFKKVPAFDLVRCKRYSLQRQCAKLGLRGACKERSISEHFSHMNDKKWSLIKVGIKKCT